MRIQKKRFNIYFVALLAAALACGCTSDKTKRNKEVSTLRLHIEANNDGSNLIKTVPIYRDQPFMLTVQREAFLTEGDILEAKVFDALGGFAMSLKFDRQGTWLLDQFTVANHGKHYAIFSQWPPKPGDKLNDGRWLAAPQITDHIADGVIIFTPDATREEAEQIALGLNHVAKKLKTGSGFNM